MKYDLWKLERRLSAGFRCLFKWRETGQKLWILGLVFTESLCVLIRVAGTRQAVSWVKESWRREEELYWNSWMHLETVHATVLCYLNTSANAHSPRRLTWLCRLPLSEWGNVLLMGMLYIFILWLIWFQESCHLISLWLISSEYLL